MSKVKPLVVITVEGGVVQDVSISRDLSDLETIVTVVDHDDCRDDDAEGAVKTADELIKKAVKTKLMDPDAIAGGPLTTIDELKKRL